MRIALIVGLMLLPVAAHAQFEKLPKVVQDAIEAQKKECGEKIDFKPNFAAVRDINGDGIEDYILDYGYAPCGDFESFFCGTGGCLTQVFASLSNGRHVKVLDESVRSLKFQKIGKRSLMVLDLHGSACGKVGAASCPRVLAWDGKAFNRAITVPGMVPRK